MKPSKRSLLDKNSTQENYQDHNFEESARSFVPNRSEEIPYTAFEDQPQIHHPPRDIEMKQMHSNYNPKILPQQNMVPYQQQNMQHSSYRRSQMPRNEHEAVQDSLGSEKSSIHQGKSQLGQQSMVYRIPSQYQGSVIRLDQNAMSVMRKEPYVPPISVECPHCDCKQHIPGSADQYYCGKCHELNDIVPKFGFFICGVCHQKVCYPYQTSDHIQCNLCYSVNIVPTSPPPRPSSSKVKLEAALNESEIILPKDLRQEGERQALDEATTMQGQEQQMK